MMFHLDLTKTQIEIMVAFLKVQQQLEKVELSLMDISRITGLDYTSTLTREKEWLITNKILKLNIESGRYKFEFDNIAWMLFEHSELKIIYDFALHYGDWDIPKEPI